MGEPAMDDNIPFKVTWKHVDMKPDATYEGEKKDMRAFALKTAVDAFNKPDNNAEKDIAAQIKKEFDKEYTVSRTAICGRTRRTDIDVLQPTWHCIVGSSFGSQFHYEPHKYVHFFIEKTGIVLYKYG